MLKELLKDFAFGAAGMTFAMLLIGGAFYISVLLSRLEMPTLPAFLISVGSIFFLLVWTFFLGRFLRGK